MPKIDKSFPYFNRKPGEFISLKSPDPQRYSRHGAGELNPYSKSNCWRIHTYSKEFGDNVTNDPLEGDHFEGTIRTGFYEIASDGSTINEDFKPYRFEVGKDNIELHMATKALNNLERCQLEMPGDDGTIEYSDVILTSTFNKQSLRQSVIRQKSLANFMKACERIFNITGKSVYVLNPTKCQIRKLIKSETNKTVLKELTTSPFFEPKVIKKTLDTLKIEVWDHNWTNSDPTFAKQTKQWFPNINPS